MFFSDWKEKSNGLSISPRLLWEYDMSRFDWNDMKVVVMQRIIERGTMDDFYAAIALYGGLDPVRAIIQQIPVLSDKDMNFVCNFFNLEKEELKCYTKKQSRERLLIS